MSRAIFPYAVRTFGFDAAALAYLERVFADPQGKGYGYFMLAEDNLQDPDLYIARGPDLRAMVRLSDLRPSEVRPALLLGTPALDLPYPCLREPIEAKTLIAALDRLVEKRADALARLQASDVVLVPERRRRDRAEVGVRNPAEFEKMRVTRPENGIVLVVDKSAALSDYLRELLARHKLGVAWVDDEASAANVCRQTPAAIVFINTSTPGVDPYRLCSALKEKGANVNPAVVFLVSPPFVYDTARAREAGVDGFLNKPLERFHPDLP